MKSSDINSNLTKTVDKNGNTQKSTYDYQNHLTELVAKEKKTGKETVHTYTYNDYGDVATQDDTAFVYDDVSGQVTKETTKLTKNKDVVKNYRYDSAGNKSAFSVKVGDDTKLSLQYTYDGASRLAAVTDETGNKVVEYAYDTDGNLSERTVAGNGLTTTYAYDYQNHLTSLKNQTKSAGVISEYTSEYLTNGQKSKETADTMAEDGKKSKKTATYTYDLLGRITKETKTGSEDISYIYDSNNNRKEMTAGNKVTAYKYNKNDELLRTDILNTDTERNSVVIYKNDRNGNQLATVNRYEIPSDKKDNTYVDIDVTLGDNRLNDNVVNHYNALNQLTQTLTKNYKVSFTYDVEGLRTSKTVNGEKTVFVWDGDQVVMELSESGKVQKRYIRGNDLVYADKGTGTEKLYYVINLHGDIIQLTDETGKVIKTYEYDSFGNEVNPEKKDENLFRYCGEYYDKETEKIYLRARYYQTAVGRFLTRDTYTGEEEETLTLNLYTYCENDGVNKIDPTGHWGGRIHKKITKNALKRVKNTKKYKRYSYKDIINGCTLPDRERNGGKTIVGLSLKDEKKGKYSGRWHGKAKKTVNELLEVAKKKYKNKQYSNRKKSILLGCVFHSIEDWYAHSYKVPVNYYKNHYYEYSRDDAPVVFHDDREAVFNKNDKVIKLKNFDPERHSDRKDNPNWDFVKGNWKRSSFSCNKRITEATDKVVNYFNSKKVK